MKTASSVQKEIFKWPTYSNFSLYTECGGLVKEPLQELSFQRGDKITESECQWNIGDITEPNGDNVILVIDPVDYCR